MAFIKINISNPPNQVTFANDGPPMNNAHVQQIKQRATDRADPFKQLGASAKAAGLSLYY